MHFNLVLAILWAYSAVVKSSTHAEAELPGHATDVVNVESVFRTRRLQRMRWRSLCQLVMCELDHFITIVRLEKRWTWCRHLQERDNTR